MVKVFNAPPPPHIHIQSDVQRVRGGNSLRSHSEYPSNLFGFICVHCIFRFPFFFSVFSVALVNREITHVHTHTHHTGTRTQWISYLGLFAFTSCVMPSVLLSAFRPSPRTRHIATLVRVLYSWWICFACMLDANTKEARRVRDSVWKWEDKKIDFFIVTALFLVHKRELKAFRPFTHRSRLREKLHMFFSSSSFHLPSILPASIPMDTHRIY